MSEYIEQSYPNLDIAYDRVAHAVYIDPHLEGEFDKTVELVPGVHLDLDDSGNVIGVEVLR